MCDVCVSGYLLPLVFVFSLLWFLCGYICPALSLLSRKYLHIKVTTCNLVKFAVGSFFRIENPVAHCTFFFVYFFNRRKTETKTFTDASILVFLYFL